MRLQKCSTIFKLLIFHAIVLIYVKVQLIKGPIVYKGERLLVMEDCPERQAVMVC